MTAKRCLRGHDVTIVGRDSSGRCRRCKVEAMRAARAPQREATARARAERAAGREAEERRVLEEADARRQCVLEEADRRREAEYQAAIKRGGYDATMALWDRAFSETLEATGSRYGLCQWEDEVDGESTGRICYRRTTDVYCHMHDRWLERRRKAQQSEDRAAVPVQPAAPRARRTPTKHTSSRWAAYKAQHPERARFYDSSTWRSMRERQLRDYPTCVVCGQKAGHVDHVLAISLGGSEDGKLQSMCANHHHEKTVRDSHEAAKRAAARRRERQR